MSESQTGRRTKTGGALSVVDLYPPLPEVIDQLRQLVELAERGEIRGFGLVAHTAHQSTATIFELGDADVAHLVTAIERLKLRLLDEH